VKEEEKRRGRREREKIYKGMREMGRKRVKACARLRRCCAMACLFSCDRGYHLILRHKVCGHCEQELERSQRSWDSEDQKQVHI